MENIELTKEHKTKLLEMCKKLFPKDTIYKFDNYDNIVFLINHIITKYNDKLSGERWDKKLYIHWFEFCMTHLFTKLIVNKYGYESISDAMSNGYYVIYSVNPIDYLYEKFKNLK